MLLGVLIVDEKLAVLAVAMGLVAGDRDQVEDAVRLVEDRVHLFQGAVGGFGVEEVDDGEDDCIAGSGLDGRQGKSRGDLHDRKDDVSFIPDVLESHGRDHDNQEVEDPVTGGG